MQWSDLSFRPDRRMLRQFAGLWLLVFGGLAAWHGLVLEHETRGLILAGLALTVGWAGLVRPGSVRPIYVAWSVLAFPIGWTVSRLILAVVYYGVFTPVGLGLRLLGRDPLLLRPPGDRETNWIAIPATDDPRRYFDQF
ncbi:SxtJ family membrane protein [Tautonia sp. JC769]|uniref:SxtJ family membrane protein n=1 Tax=Tautonia sp. JC769 TaxID=3232135 RepID=UPI00345886CE